MICSEFITLIDSAKGSVIPMAPILSEIFLIHTISLFTQSRGKGSRDCEPQLNS